MNVFFYNQDINGLCHILTYGFLSYDIIHNDRFHDSKYTSPTSPQKRGRAEVVRATLVDSLSDSRTHGSDASLYDRVWTGMSY